MADTNPQMQQIEEVERSLYNRMLRNAFAGSLKGAAVGVIMGLVVGMIIAPFMGATTLAAITPVAMKAAAWLGGLAGSFGAVAGIQSTRDTRRFFLMHESPQEPAPEANIGQAPGLQQAVAQTIDQDAYHRAKLEARKAESHIPIR